MTDTYHRLAIPQCAFDHQVLIDDDTINLLPVETNMISTVSSVFEHIIMLETLCNVMRINKTFLMLIETEVKQSTIKVGEIEKGIKHYNYLPGSLSHSSRSRMGFYTL